jgi:hypothetical protein
VPLTGFVADSDVVKALSLLIHDLRAPLSVAHGYLRLLKDDHLNSAADRERALNQTIEALTKMSQLCNDASEYAAAGATVTPATLAPLDAFIADVRAACAAFSPGGFPIDVDADQDRDAASRSIRVRDRDRLVRAVAVIFCAVGRAAGTRPVGVSVSMTAGSARFLMGTSDSRRRLASPEPAAPFDPWSGGHTIALPLACRTIAESDGEIGALADTRAAVTVTLPLAEWPA